MTMNVTNIQQYLNSAAFMPKPGIPGQDVAQPNHPEKKVEEKEEIHADLKLPGSKKDESEQKKERLKLEDLVMKPSPISLEERMSQVISPEQVKDLLSLITRFPVQKADTKHNLDVKR